MNPQVDDLKEIHIDKLCLSRQSIIMNVTDWY
jgi:hypothetical protein